MDLYNACKDGNKNHVQIIIAKKGRKDWDMGLAGACQGKHMDIVQLMIDKGAINFHLALHYACMGGDMSIINLMIEKSRIHEGNCQWNLALSGACQNGNLNLVKFIIYHGGNEINNWDIAFYRAGLHDHMHLVEFLLSLDMNFEFRDKEHKKHYINYLKSKCLITKINHVPLELINEIKTYF